MQAAESEMEMLKLCWSDVKGIIWDINFNLPEHRKCPGGDFPPAYFGIRGDWLAHLEAHGHIEIDSHFSKCGRPVVIAIDQ